MKQYYSPGGGGYMTCGWTRVCRLVFRKYPLLITETCYHTHFYDELWRKTTHLWLFFANFWITHPCLWKICRKRDPRLENFGSRNPPIWAAHTRTLSMLCSPPPGYYSSSYTFTCLVCFVFKAAQTMLKSLLSHTFF